MTKLKVLKYPHPILKTPTKPVEKITAEIKQQVADMIETMYHENGGGPAANQVGIPLRIFTMDASGTQNQPQVYINPKITQKSGEIKEVEGCLSFPGVEVIVKRAKTVTIEALDLDGNKFTKEFDNDYSARCVQHELDHLDGITFFDRLSPLKRKMVEKKYLAKS